jgi:hypothetical protein
MEALLLLAAAADDDQQPDDTITESDAPAVETLLDRYRLSQQSRALNNSRSRGRANWETALNGVPSRKGSNGSTGDNSYVAESSAAGGASRRRASFSRMMSTTKASISSSGGKEPEVLALRRAYTKTYMENRRLTGM